MMTKEESQLLTRVGPGTPAGELLRRYWQPVALSEELPSRAAPVPVKILGEDLVLFRDDRGRAGLLGIRCSHRGTDLSYGRIEDGGLRCLYHGWLYDVEGRCLEQPGEPGGGERRHEKPPAGVEDAGSQGRQAHEEKKGEGEPHEVLREPELLRLARKAPGHQGGEKRGEDDPGRHDEGEREEEP